VDFSKNDLSKARVGDEIWDLFKQEFQTIEAITPNSNWSIEFEGGAVCSFGGFTPNNVRIPRYYLGKIEFEIPPAPSAPKRMVKKKLEHWDLAKKGGCLIGCAFKTKKEAEEFAKNNCCNSFVYPVFVSYEMEVEE